MHNALKKLLHCDEEPYNIEFCENLHCQCFLYYIYMSSDCLEERDSHFCAIVQFGSHVSKSFTCDRCFDKDLLCRRVSKGPYGVGKPVY